MHALFPTHYTTAAYGDQRFEGLLLFPAQRYPVVQLEVEPGLLFVVFPGEESNCQIHGLRHEAQRHIKSAPERCLKMHRNSSGSSRRNVLITVHAKAHTRMR